MEALSATVAAKADMAAVTTLLADKADAAELAGVSSSSSDTVEAHSGRLASLEAEVAETKSQLANGVSRQEYSTLSAVVSETKEGLSKAERSIDDVRETLVASQDVLRQEHGAALAALEASDTAQQAQADDVAALVEAQAALQLRVTELQTSKDTLQESVITLDEAVEKAKVPVDEMGLRLSAIELKMVDATTETKLRYALSHA
jgi:chromosome segregation ATPase